MPGRGYAGELRDDASHHGTQVALLDVELPHRVGDVDDLDLPGGDAGARHGAHGGLLDQVTDLQRLLGEVTGEVALIAADDPDRLLRRHVRSFRNDGGSAATAGTGVRTAYLARRPDLGALHIIAVRTGRRHTLRSPI